MIYACIYVDNNITVCNTAVNFMDNNIHVRFVGLEVAWQLYIVLNTEKQC